MVIWEVTRACDLVCRHCRAEAQPLAHPGELTTEQGFRLLEQVSSFGRPAPLLVLTGGDPFKRADLFELVSKASLLGLIPAVSPSGTPLLSRERLRELKQRGARAISLSLDASTREVHDRFRGVAGSFELTLAGARAARDLGLKLQVNTTVGRHNLADLEAVARLVHSLGVMTWSVFFLVPTGRGRQEEELSPQESEEVLQFLAEAARYLPVKTTEGHHFKRVLLMREEGRLALPASPLADLPLRATRTPLHLNGANGFVFVSHTGEVFPTGFLPLTGGNVKRRSLVDIYRLAPLFQQLRDPAQLKGRCGACEYREVCGGSRGRAFAVTGDPLAEDPLCGYIPTEFVAAATMR